MVKTKIGVLMMALILLLAGRMARPAQAQMNTAFERMFNEVLNDRLFTEALFGGQFEEAADSANRFLTPVLNNLIAGNIASFPLPSMIPGTSVSTRRDMPEVFKHFTSLFAETPETLGRGNISVGVNYSAFGLDRFRGLPTDEFRFTLLSRDLDADDTLGSLVRESETIDFFPDIHLDANVFVVFATVGLTDRLDVGVAVPVMALRLRGEARAVINSVTFVQFGIAVNNFNNDPLNPQLVYRYRYEESAFGLGDVALRAKYAFRQNRAVDLALLLDARLPYLADKDNFLSTGNANVKLLGIVAKKFGDWAPHLNVGYEYRGADFDSDEVEFALGFEKEIFGFEGAFGEPGRYRGLKVFIDLLGEINLERGSVADRLPGTRTLRLMQSVRGAALATIVVNQNNIPDRRDHVVNLALGAKVSQSRHFSMLANVLVPLQEGGLRSRVVPTFGMALNY